MMFTSDDEGIPRILVDDLKELTNKTIAVPKKAQLIQTFILSKVNISEPVLRPTGKKTEK